MARDTEVADKVPPNRKTRIEYIEANETWQKRIAAEWGEKAARHMHIRHGFSILALHEQEPVGLISICWKTLTYPAADTFEGYIDIIEVLAGYRRQGIARRLVRLSADSAKNAGAYQLRAWSSEDKTEAIHMWKALGFGLHPGTVTVKTSDIHGCFVTMVL